jgi:hypothetical protein
MSERPPKPPRLSDAGRARRESRRARLAEALRANLKKRKAQARDRAEEEDKATGGRHREPGGETGGKA